jgi:serine/threonine protein kinase
VDERLRYFVAVADELNFTRAAARENATQSGVSQHVAAAERTLGVTLFEVLAGVPPFSGSTQAELLVAILGSDPPPLRAIDPTLPKDLEAVVQHCLERDVLKRDDSAQDLADDLQRFLAGAPVSVKPVA